MITILQRQETGTRINKQPLIKFQMRVNIPGQEPYLAHHQEVAGLLDIQRIAVGEELPVLIHPTNPQWMAICWKNI